ncbi:MAG: hypothetical protein Fur0024_5550 [Patescibacteria group bacterium]
MTDTIRCKACGERYKEDQTHICSKKDYKPETEEKEEMINQEKDDKMINEYLIIACYRCGKKYDMLLPNCPNCSFNDRTHKPIHIL